MDQLADEQQKNILRERNRISHLQRYHNNAELRQYHIEYVAMRRQDPEFRARRNALERASRARKKLLKEAKENLPVSVD